MESCGSGRPWGKLVKLDSSETVLLFNKECTVGRKKGCHLSLSANKLVSGEHCKIVQDESSGQAWLEDMSTNGTMINMSKLIKKQTHMLQNGDVIYFVYRKNEPEQNVAYVYHSIRTEKAVSQHSHDMERSADSPAPPSEIPLSVEPVMLTKTPRDPSQEEPQPSTSTSHFCISSPSTSAPVAAAACPASGQAKDAAPAQEEDNMEPESKKRKTDDDKDYDLDLPHTSSTEVVSPTKARVLSKSPVGGTKTDKMEESLTCVICQDLLHDCVSLQPCMHVFCAACYSGWMERSSLCPTCRCPVERIRKNHILNNLVEAYLIQHPEKCRSDEDLKSMDSRNKITQDMLQPKVERSFSDEEGSSDYLFELSDNDSFSDGDSSDITSQPILICRQCPGYTTELSQMLLATGSDYWPSGLPFLKPVPRQHRPAAEEGSAKPTAEQPSTSSDIPAAPQEYLCPPQGSHLLCTCCLQPMPDRWAELTREQVAAQRCVLCQRPFCHMYWGCQRIGCHGCLARFSELNLTDRCMDGVLNNNNYESEILQNYLSTRGKTWRDVLQESLQASQQGLYHLSDCHVSPNAILCITCGLRTFKELAYKYRQNIPEPELPAAVTSRPDCYWGRNCRTQLKAHHAMKFNHICEQTRFKS